jgi:hypothetical protein
MQPMYFEWPLTGRDSSVVINNIPAGMYRVFTGVLIDPMQGFIAQGSDTVAIAAGNTTPVHIILRSSGSAVVSVEIEGEQPVTPIRGCYTVTENFDRLFITSMTVDELSTSNGNFLGYFFTNDTLHGQLSGTLVAPNQFIGEWKSDTVRYGVRGEYTPDGAVMKLSAYRFNDTTSIIGFATLTQTVCSIPDSNGEPQVEIFCGPDTGMGPDGQRHSGWRCDTVYFYPYPYEPPQHPRDIYCHTDTIVSRKGKTLVTTCDTLGEIPGQQPTGACVSDTQRVALGADLKGIASSKCSKKKLHLTNFDIVSMDTVKLQATFCYTCCAEETPLPPTPHTTTCIVDTMGGPTSCKDMQTWTTYARSECALRGLILNDIRPLVPCWKDSTRFEFVEFTACR